MTVANSVNCKSKFTTLDGNRHRARLIDEAFPLCACECCSIGESSPGNVGDCEEIYRFFVSPGDVDERTNQVFTTAFEKAAQNGLGHVPGSGVAQR